MSYRLQANYGTQSRQPCSVDAAVSLEQLPNDSWPLFNNQATYPIENENLSDSLPATNFVTPVTNVLCRKQTSKF